MSASSGAPPFVATPSIVLLVLVFLFRKTCGWELEHTLVSLRVCLERRAGKSLGKTNMCKRSREQKDQQGLLVS